ncbi:MAG TPA: hypothetical protein K8V95_02565 [Staphylococcus arlettae]|nr:hypothetical protein [Staphylococcus arlettae]
MSKTDPNQAKFGMTDAQIDAAMTRLVINCQSEANKAVNRAAQLYAGRLRQNAPRQEKEKYEAKYVDKRHSADFIKVTRARQNDGRPEAKVGFLVTRGLGWYMHFPDGGTVVRGTLHQPAQNFIERTQNETVRPIKALFRNAIKRGFDK